MLFSPNHSAIPSISNKKDGEREGGEAAVKTRRLFSGLDDETEGFTCLVSTTLAPSHFTQFQAHYGDPGSWAEHEENFFREKMKTHAGHKPSSVTVHAGQTKPAARGVTASAGLWNNTSLF